MPPKVGVLSVWELRVHGASVSLNFKASFLIFGSIKKVIVKITMNKNKHLGVASIFFFFINFSNYKWQQYSFFLAALCMEVFFLIFKIHLITMAADPVIFLDLYIRLKQRTVTKQRCFRPSVYICDTLNYFFTDQILSIGGTQRPHFNGFKTGSKNY